MTSVAYYFQSVTYVKSLDAGTESINRFKLCPN